MNIKIINTKITLDKEVKEIMAKKGNIYRCENETEITKWNPESESEKKFKILQVRLDDGITQNAVTLVEQGFAKFEETNEPKMFIPTILEKYNYPKPNDNNIK